MKHYATPRFWYIYRNLAEPIQRLADKNYELLKANSHHPSLHFKAIGRFWSVRIGLGHRALAVTHQDSLVLDRVTQRL